MKYIKKAISLILAAGAALQIPLTSASAASSDWSVIYGGSMGEYYVSIGYYKGSGGSVVLPEELNGYRVSYICAAAFKDNQVIDDVTLPDNIDGMGNGVFKNSSVTAANIPLSLSIVPKETFLNCERLRSIYIHENIEYIRENSFDGCTELESISFSEGCTGLKISQYAFNGSGLKEVVLPDNTTVQSFAFQNCQALEGLDIGSNTSVSSNAFRFCTSLETVTAGSGSELGDNAFMDCTSLKNVNYDTSVNINGNAFNGCTELMYINSTPVFDAETGDLVPELRDFVFASFNAADDVGFVNAYVQAQVDRIVRENITDDMSDMEKLKVLHDWVCEHTAYDCSGAGNAPKNHNDASIFLNDTTVCEGYARACNLIYNAAGIETQYVHSPTHAWNIVKLGGHYFHVDATWDDGDIISHKWFLKSDSELENAGAPHADWSVYVPSSMHSFQSSTLPVCEYSSGDVNTDGDVNISDLVMLQRYVLGTAVLNADDYPLSDLNYDGITNSLDTVRLRVLLIQ